ncbi:MAG: hypothetical protein JKY31_04065 [Rhodobacteraceae bacterium]|nr:hypothetical protein [Paracoccaceae bacterium]
MKRLSQFDCICYLSPGAPASHRDDILKLFPNAVILESNQNGPMIEAIKPMTGAYLLVLPPFVIPQSALAISRPDPLLLEAGYRISWMVRNVVTGEILSEPAPELWRRQDVLDQLLADSEGVVLQKPPLAVMPECQADWVFNTSSGAAFSAGFEHVKRLLNDAPSDLNTRLSVAASLGRDTLFCDWWHLGVLNAALGETDRNGSFHREKKLTAEKGTMPQRLGDLSRKARLQQGINVQNIGAKNSRFFKKNKFLMPPASVYSALAAQYKPLGFAGEKYSKQYLEAAGWIWGDP